MLNTRGKNIQNKNLRLSFFLKDFSLYSNAPPSDSMQVWAKHGLLVLVCVKLRTNPPNSLPELVNNVKRYTLLASIKIKSLLL